MFIRFLKEEDLIKYNCFKVSDRSNKKIKVIVFYLFLIKSLKLNYYMVKILDWKLI